ncbi:DNA polymerase III subunit gamma/tau [Azoarcus taiwanensis]|uniref:DNA polymerase III subunit gamma/tau n=1 Tax=Azoarcus taiwanensis TaxID=666964 RepID=A0A972F6A9_9RHOO|nr:DNA polymerase III subunit gamma/tau [Azoarcus taiwanensis]NMG01700.1 DNA polymerase III subunit gamma/tau [Azoarcus taiwanensis]
MSYQVLARKWRPRSFASLVGQEHVVRALTHALETGRLHHAWLFTGTRGVGKTTISRILAKALNCETGVTAEPCGQCSACLAIDADRFPDYVEMDAASNRGVDDMAALLDQAMYAPVQGRYKVYMIDEVHMLTGHAFNAMLKTLEEPPEHVKFILATTDPQKIPVTVLSRCLQFNLKQMPPGHIVEHLSRVLEAEAVPFDAPALRHIAKAASGSMRDALSLLDQAIAHGAGKVEAEQVANMLGTVGDDHLYAVLEALAAGDVRAMLEVADGMQARSLSFDAALQTLASLLHRLSLMQFAPEAISDPAERETLASYAAFFEPEFLQLAYQIVIHGRDELALAPDDYAGFTMVLLRLHAFRPETPAAGAESGGGRSAVESGAKAPAARLASPPLSAASATGGRMSVPDASPSRAESGPTPSPAERAVAADNEPVPAVEANAQTSAPGLRSRGDVPPWEALPEEAAGADEASLSGIADRAETEIASHAEISRPVDASSPQPLGQQPACDGVQAMLAAGDWHGVCQTLELGGMLRELAQHCEWVGMEGAAVDLRLSTTHHHLLDLNTALPGRLGELLSERVGRQLKVRIQLGEIAGETPAQRNEAERLARHADAVAALEADPFVRELIERFDATLVEASVKPL